ncbi:MAG: hypothetical protein GQ532_14160 [Methylomarinum sp.]|nr:hypothetical protein [Methylomarinum sp.]
MNIQQLKEEIQHLCLGRSGTDSAQTVDVLSRLRFALTTTNIFKETTNFQKCFEAICDSVAHFNSYSESDRSLIISSLVGVAAKNNPILLAGIFGYEDKG